MKRVLSWGAWGRVAVASTTEEALSFPHHSHTAEGFTFIELLVEFALHKLIVKLAGLTLASTK